MMLALQSLLGILLIPLAALALAQDRDGLKAFSVVRWIGLGLGLQIALAALLTQLPGMRVVFDGLGQAVFALQRAVEVGARFVFGYLAGGPTPYEVKAPASDFIIAFRVFPMLIVLSALIRLLYHWGVLQAVVHGFALLLKRSLGIGGPLATASAASIFLGLIEAPMVIRPYIRDLGRGALFAILVCTMATVAGTVMALYAAILAPTVPGAAGHLLAASIINVPAALMLSRLVVPSGFTGGPTEAAVQLDDPPRSSMDAIAQGTSDGVKILAGVLALLVVAVALVALVNSILALVAEPFGVTLTLERLLGLAFAPVAWLIGVPWSEAVAAGGLLGKKLVLNELIAYFDLAQTPPGVFSERTRLILTYALCGFANFASLGISIGGLAAMAPERRADFVDLAPLSVVVGTMATLLSGAVIGALTWT